MNRGAHADPARAALAALVASIPESLALPREGEASVRVRAGALKAVHAASKGDTRAARICAALAGFEPHRCGLNDGAPVRLNVPAQSLRAAMAYRRREPNKNGWAR